MNKILIIENYNIEGECKMSSKLTATKLKMAALGNNNIEAGAEIYSDPEIKNKIKNKAIKKESK